MARREEEEEFSFLNAVVGLILEPGYATELLLRRRSPPFAITLILLLFITIFVPIVGQILKYKYTVYDPHAVTSLFVVMAFLVFTFTVLETLLLRLLRIEVSWRQLLAAVGYALTPLIVAIWLIYGFNYATSGSLTLVRVLVTGFSSHNDLFLRVVPIALVIAALNVLLVFFYGLRSVADSDGLTTSLLFAMSSIPLGLGLFFSCFLGEAVHPGTIDTFVRILADPVNLTTFR